MTLCCSSSASNSQSLTAARSGFDAGRFTGAMPVFSFRRNVRNGSTTFIRHWRAKVWTARASARDNRRPCCATKSVKRRTLTSTAYSSCSLKHALATPRWAYNLTEYRQKREFGIRFVTVIYSGFQEDPSISRHRFTTPASIPNKSSARPTLCVTMSSIDFGRL